MRTVTHDEFYAWVAPRNVHPRSERDRTLWVDLVTHEVIAISTPGYALIGARSYQIQADRIER